VESAIDTLPEGRRTADDIMKGYAASDENSGVSEKKENEQGNGSDGAEV
jgi:hypothetical protein